MIESMAKLIRAIVGGIKRDLASLYPDVAGRQHILAVRSDEEREASTVSGGYYQGTVEYEQHVWVHKAVSVWADALGPLRIGVVGNSGAVSYDHPVAVLLANPSEVSTASDLWKAWAVDMGLGGEVGWEIVRGKDGRIAEIHHRQPTEFAVRPDGGRQRYGRVEGYVMFPDDQDRYTLPPGEFKHFKFYNPANPWRGLAPLSAVRMGVTIDALVQSWSRLFFSNSARPDYAVIAPAGLTATEREEIEFKLSEKFGKADGWHRPVVLEEGVQDIKVFSFPRKDLEWSQQRIFSRDEIGAIFGVPDEIMGYGRNTYENFDTAERVLWSLTIKNLIDFRDEQLTHWFHRYGSLRPSQRLVTDVSRVWALRRAAQAQMTDALALYTMGVPFNTVDEFLGLGVGPVPGGDIPHPGTAGDEAITTVGERPGV
jgi:HK97 family phage portal protein